MTETVTELYRFFSAFSGFGEEIPLGFEAAGAGGGWKNRIYSAVFSLEAQRTRTRAYVNGSGIYRGMCTVTLLACDNDTDARLHAASVLGALCDDVTARGDPYTVPESGNRYRIRIAGTPVRAYRLADGAAWEIRFTYEMKMEGKR